MSVHGNPGITMIRRTALVAVAVALGMVVVGPPTVSLAVPADSATALETVNVYRIGSGLAPVADDRAGNQGIANHLAYMANTPTSLRTGQYANAHTENPASPWYTTSGDQAARSSNIGGGTSPRNAIDGWMRAPFHAIGVLRPHLESISFGISASGSAMLNVISGLGGSPSPLPTVLFPGNGSNTYLNQFTGELPDPREGCGGGNGRQFSGLPLIALLPTEPVAGITAELTRPDGSTQIAGADLCVQTGATFNSSDPIYGSTGKAILQGDNAVLVIPRTPLNLGRHGVVLRQPGRPNVSWSFNVVSPSGGSGGADGSPRPPGKTTVANAGTGADAALVNLTMTQGTQGGYVTADKCSRLVDGPQAASNGNFVAGQTVANLAVVPVDPDASLCLYNSGAVHLVVDTQGVFSATGSLRYSPTTPTRLLDSRRTTRRASGSSTRVATGAPAGSQAALVNLTMTDATQGGYITADKCSRLTAGTQAFSNGNFGVQQTLANLAVVSLDSDGSFCVYSSGAVHLIVDTQGFFTASGGHGFTSARPRRQLDTRSGARVGGGQVVRITAGADPGSEAVLVNLTMTEGLSGGYITADKCSRLAPGPQSHSSGNFGAQQTVANLSVVPVDSDGSFCVYTSASVHLVVDIQGVFSASGPLRFTPSVPNRLLDTRKTG